jgi:hypothetical protein
MRAVMGMERRMRRNGGERNEDFLYREVATTDE